MDRSIEKIKGLIKHPCKDSLLGHCKTTIYNRMGDFSGEISDSHISIWKLSSSIGSFYPVLIFDLQSNKPIVKTKMNSVSKLMIIVFSCVYFFIGYNSLQDTTEFTGKMWLCIIGIGFYLLLTYIFKFVLQKVLKS